MTDDDDTPTHPRFGMALCPACDGEGGYLVESYSTIAQSFRRARCYVCKGKRYITRTDFLKWRKVL